MRAVNIRVEKMLHQKQLDIFLEPEEGTGFVCASESIYHLHSHNTEERCMLNSAVILITTSGTLCMHTIQ